MRVWELGIRRASACSTVRNFVCATLSQQRWGAGSAETDVSHQPLLQSRVAHTYSTRAGCEHRASREAQPMTRACSLLCSRALPGLDARTGRPTPRARAARDVGEGPAVPHTVELPDAACAGAELAAVGFEDRSTGTREMSAVAPLSCHTCLDGCLAVVRHRWRHWLAAEREVGVQTRLEWCHILGCP